MKNYRIEIGALAIHNDRVEISGRNERQPFMCRAHDNHAEAAVHATRNPDEPVDFRMYHYAEGGLVDEYLTMSFEHAGCELTLYVTPDQLVDLTKKMAAEVDRVFSTEESS